MRGTARIAVLAFLLAACTSASTPASSTAARTSTTAQPVTTTTSLPASTTTTVAPPELSLGPILPVVAVESPTITIQGKAAAATSVHLVVSNPEDGSVVYETEATIEDDWFLVDVDLADGRNVVKVTGIGPGGSTDVSFEKLYEPDATIEFSYLTRVSDTELVADFAQWLTGEEAARAAYEDGVIGSIEEGVPNDYYIRNVNTRLRTFPIAGDVQIWLATAAEGPVIMVPVDLETWLGLFNDGAPWDPDAGEVPPGEPPHFDYFGAGSVHAPYWLTIRDGEVIAIEHQYTP